MLLIESACSQAESKLYHMAVCYCSSVINHGVFMVHNIYNTCSTASTYINKVHFPHTMDILAQSYELKGMVCCASHHFTETINNVAE